MSTIELGTVLANLTPEMKTKYLPGLERTVYQKLILSNRLRPNQVHKVGYDYKVSYQVALSEGGSMFPYNGTLATPGSSIYDNLTGGIKHRNVSMLVYGASKSLTDATEKAYVDAVTNEIKSKAEAEGLEQERIMFGSCVQGIGKFTTAGASHSGGVVTITLDPAFTGRWACKYIRKGKKVDLYNADSAISNGAGLAVLNVLSRTTFTVAGNAQLATDINTAGAAGTGYVWSAGSKTYPEYYGSWDLIGSATNTIHDVDRNAAGNDWYKPNVYYQGASGPVLGEKQATNYDWNPDDLATVLMDTINIKGADKGKFLFFGDTDQERYMIQQQQNAGEMVIRNRKVDNWPYEVVEFSSVPFISTEMCWPNMIFGWNTECLMAMENQKLDWTPFGQSYWTRYVDSNGFYDAFMAAAVERRENSVRVPSLSFTYWNLKGASD
jgi:hypothetical protein